MLRIGFHGGAGTVTGSRHLVMTDDEQVLVDCGMYQGLKALREKNWEPPPFDPRRVRSVVLTHAHIDHSGMLPRLAKAGFKGRVFCTPPTADLTRLMLRDAARLQEEDAAFLNRKGLTKHHPALPLFTTEDAETAIALLTPKPYEANFDAGKGFAARFHDAGHLLGAATVEMSVLGNGGATILFSGDLGRPDMPLNTDPAPPPQSDFMVLESTYGDRPHPAEDLNAQVERVVKETLARGGILVIPAFAVGRSQQMIYVLNVLMNQRRIPMLPIHLDSPMAADATTIHRAHPAYHEAGMELRAGNVHLHRTVDESKLLNDFRGPGIIISSSGMLSGGRILHHLKRLLPDERATIALIGFQAAGTRGRALQEGAQAIRIHGDFVPVRARVVYLSGFSGHADADEIMRWLEPLDPGPRQTFLVHGEPAAAAALAGRIGAERGWKTTVPALGEIVNLIH